MNAQEQAMTAAINAARAARGVGALRGDERLATAAQRHAADMAAHPGLVHEGSDGSDGARRIFEAGYPAAAWLEVVGWGFQGEPAPMVEWWMNSPEHMPKLLSADVDDIGVGYATGLGPWGHYWCVDFGRADWRGRYE